MSRKPRPLNYIQRRKPFREQYERILIVCEGTKTEPKYFGAMKRKLHLTSLVVEGKHCKSEPDKVVGYAVELKTKAAVHPEEAFDHVWCILDVEAPTPHAPLEKAINTAKAEGIKLALSNPCFEYWYILHYKKTSAPFHTSKAVVASLEKYHPQYQKGSDDIVEAIYPDTKTAIKNAKEVLKEKHCGEDLSKSGCNPSTHVHKIVEYLQKMSKQPTDK